MSFEPSFAVRGFTLMHWQRLPGDMQWRTFRWKNFDGLLRFTDGEIQIVAVMTDTPGSGKLGALMTQFEAIAKETARAIQVTQIWNDRLAKWMSRRGYKVAETRELGRHASWKPV